MYPRTLPPLSSISSLVDSLHPRYGSPRSTVRDLSSYKIGFSGIDRLQPAVSFDPHSLSQIQVVTGQDNVDDRFVAQSASHVLHDLTLPVEASVDFQRQLNQLPPKSWLDPTTWTFHIVYGQLKHLSVESLYRGYFHRAERDDWGVNHGTANKKKLVSDTSSPASEEWLVPERQGSKQNHSLAEQHRRKRHNELCRHGDNATGTHVFNITNEALPYVKAHIEGTNCSQVKKLSSSSRTTKQPGKDEQLLSAVLNHHYAAITIMALYDENVQLKREIESLRTHTQDIYMRSIPRVNSELPPMSNRKRKAEDFLDGISSLHEHISGRQALDHVGSSDQASVSKRPDLPPSPTPSFEGYGGPFVSTQQSMP